MLKVAWDTKQLNYIHSPCMYPITAIKLSGKPWYFHSAVRIESAVGDYDGRRGSRQASLSDENE